MKSTSVVEMIVHNHHLTLFHYSLLTFLTWPQVVFTADSTAVYCQRGRNASVPCDVVKPDQAQEGVIWYRDNSYLVSVNRNGQLNHYDVSVVDHFLINTTSYSLLVVKSEVADTANYTCKVFISQDAGVINRNITRRLIVQDVPAAPVTPVITEILSRSMQVKWNIKINNNNSPISLYIVQIRSEHSTKNDQREIEVTGFANNITIRELSPHTQYQIRVMAKNSIGKSGPSPPTDMTYTLSESPSSPPSHVRAVGTSNTTIRVHWKMPPPDTINGVLAEYEIIYGIMDVGPLQVISVDQSHSTSFLLSGMKPYTMYEIEVKAVNEMGKGPGAVAVTRTDEGVPSKPRITHVSNQMARSLLVNWEAPTMINGLLRSYDLIWIHNRTKYNSVISSHLDNPMSSFITALDPYTEYKIQVAATTKAGRGEYSDIYPALTDVTGPSYPSIINITVLSPTSVFVEWEPPKVYYRQIDKYFIKYWAEGQSNNPTDITVQGKYSETILENLPTNLRYHLRVAGITQSIFQKNKMFYVGDFTETYRFQLYDPNITCILDNKFIDCPITTNQTDPSAILAVTASTGFTNGAIAGIILTAVVLIAVVILVVVYRTLACRKYFHAAYYYFAVPSQAHSTPPTVETVTDTYEEATYSPVPVKEFPRHVEQLHADSDIGFSQEFYEITKQTNCELQSENSGLPENRHKNRYINIAAFDVSRVILKPVLGRLRQDYINANYIDGYKKPGAYIATQGPLPQTFADFWRMVWEQNTVVIVMITNLTERGRRKCDQYWPTDGSENYGTLTVKLINTFSRAHYTVRIFSLKNFKLKRKHSSERIIHQYHYTEWPDHGVPDYTLPGLTFIQKSAASNPNGAGPIVVHCSAGVGRTGTYILIDSMIQRIKDIQDVNIPSFLLHIRQQRNYLVQTEDQYMYIHDALVEYLLTNGKTEIADSKIVRFMHEEQSRKEDSSGSEGLIDMQYRNIASHKPKENEFHLAKKQVNLAKNRNMDTIPVNLKRVPLPTRPGVEGSDYINASYLQGYNQTNEFIITQHPLPTTVDDFWRMVWDQNSSTIVLLSHIEDEEYKAFWPEKGESTKIDVGNFNLTFQEENCNLNYIAREFILESTQDDYVLMTRIISTTYWPESCTPLHTVFELIQFVQKWYQEKCSGPVIVVDRFGGVQAGTFCALWSLYEQLQHDSAVDVYQLAKLYHFKRPGIVGSLENYQFLYKAIASLCQEVADKDANVSSLRYQGASMRNGFGSLSNAPLSKYEVN